MSPQASSTTLWPGYYDVVILPPQPVRDLAIGLSRSCGSPAVYGHWERGRF
jgi:hypothetical protein